MVGVEQFVERQLRHRSGVLIADREPGQLLRPQALDLFRREGRLPQDVGQQVEQQLQVLGQGLAAEGGGVRPGADAQAGADRFDRLVDVLERPAGVPRIRAEAVRSASPALPRIRPARRPPAIRSPRPRGWRSSRAPGSPVRSRADGAGSSPAREASARRAPASGADARHGCAPPSGGRCPRRGSRAPGPSRHGIHLLGRDGGDAIQVGLEPCIVGEHLGVPQPEGLVGDALAAVGEQRPRLLDGLRHLFGAHRLVEQAVDLSSKASSACSGVRSGRTVAWIEYRYGSMVAARPPPTAAASSLSTRAR